MPERRHSWGTAQRLQRKLQQQAIFASDRTPGT
jgi:hypothetical protein